MSKILLYSLIILTSFNSYSQNLNCNEILSNCKDFHIPYDLKEDILDCFSESVDTSNFTKTFLVAKSYNKDSNISLAIITSNLALKRCSNSIDSVRVLNYLSELHRYNLNIDEAHRYGIKALEIGKTTKDNNNIANTNIELLRNSLQQRKIDDIQFYLDRLNSISEVITNPLVTAKLYYHKARAYHYFPELNNSKGTNIIIELLNKSLKLYELNDDLSSQGDVLDFQALCYLEYDSEDFKKAELIHQKSINIRKQLNDSLGIAISELNFCNILSEQYKDFLAIEHCNISSNISSKIKSYELLYIANKNISYLYEENDSILLAFEFLKRHNIAKDSFVKQKIDEKYLDLQTQYKTKEKEQENKLLKKEKEVMNLIMWFLSGIAILLLIISSLIYRLYYQKNELNKIITSQNSELERLNSFKNQLFSIMGHDMRGMMSKLNLSQRKIFRINQKEGHKALKKPISKMGSIIDGLNGFIENILYWGFTQTDKLHFNFESLNVNQIFDQVILNFKYDLEAKELEIIKNIGPDFSITADLNTAKVVFRNLISNAIKFSQKGKSIIIETEENEAFHTIKIIDQGQGIPKEIIPILFETNPEKINDGIEGEKGTGLGLWLCQEMMESNRGKISVESEEGIGTCFILQFPKVHS